MTTSGATVQDYQSPYYTPLVDCKIEIGSVIGLVQRLVEVDMIRAPLINTPLQRGDLSERGSPNCFNSFTTSAWRKTVKTVAIDQ